MRKWWHRSGDRSPPPPPPAPEPEISLPDPDEARQALARSREAQRSTEQLAGEAREIIRSMRKAREENNFAEGIVQLIREGK